MFELAIAFLLIVINGLFALSELSIVSSRRVRLKTMAAQGRRGAEAAIRLADNPGRFLSTVQIGITLVGILAGAVSGAALGGRLGQILLDAEVPAWLAGPLGYGIVITLITYLSVVVGELVPKQIALRNPERFACMVAPGMSLLSKVGGPFVWLLDGSTKVIFRIFGLHEAPESVVTDEEIKAVMAEAEAAGVIESGEQSMIAGVMRFSDREARGLMTPRKDVDWIDLSDDPAELRQQIFTSQHSRLPVSEDGIESIMGILQTRELLPAIASGAPFDIRSYIRQAPVIPDGMDAMRVLEALRSSDVPMLLVHDEYGHFEGVLTPADVLEAIAGVFRSDIGEGEEDDYAVERADGSWLISGSMPIDELADRFGLSLPESRNYQTVAGLIIDVLQHLPVTGEIAQTQGWQFEIVDMDGRRIDKLLASKLP
ncbi:hemolysin family protein [Rhizobium sp. TRM96647]|uniref:hemolysin family protein n=1 Tax=unclassified Rhizobium TaxID=2613769 RepID=UPI0021E7B819|nr:MULTISPECIES: hemolysin family protein [unclassified Rhizobium]MCV3738064.1 hemolysin family protein [Rhizobium sp. TRM96647]MCV3759751.1 hemolysin family protein [Rhizobium sp. TRM96650]